ncbi:unnamed protein product [Clonostachys rhizophaga]|uniref:Major facilitator superfamily (MFS) profile domain-containing protein n=1 Tax=Clonostachys rhizophaga TaxID=160324 RepID=A0A9N9VAV5_9HYPO|nr:unnamed protein product [Clonostachys rhizophaga]
MSSGILGMRSNMEKVSVWEKLKFIIVCGVGFLADGYLNSCIGLVVPMLGYVYFKDSKNAVPSDKGGIIKAGLTLGMMAGQLIFGFLGDTLGRHAVYGNELILTIFGTLMCILLPWRGLVPDGIVAWMAVWRVVTGFGVGGDYPLSSSLAAEKSSDRSRAKMVIFTFYFRGLGDTIVSALFLVLLAGFKDHIEADVNQLDWVWRILMGIGIVPCILTVYARLVMEETKPYKKYVQRDNGEQNIASRPQTRSMRKQYRDFWIYFSSWRHAKVLFAVCAVWFLFDIAIYGQNLNQAIILTKIGYARGSTPYEKLWNIAVGNLVVVSTSYLPSWFIGIFLPDLIGRRAQQLYGSLLVAVIYAIWTGVTNNANKDGLIALYAIAQLAMNASINMTTFLLPAELFPTRIRATAHGVAAASGKVGAALTAFAFGIVTDEIHIQGVLGLFTGLMVLCALLTLLIPETKGTTLDDLENDTLYVRERDEAGDIGGTRQKQTLQ